MGFNLISVNRCYNNVKKRRQNNDSKCGYHYRAFYRDDLGGFKSIRISKIEAIKLKTILKIHKVKSKQIRYVICSECGYKQEDLGLDICSNCKQ